MRELETIFGQQIQLKWDYYLQKIKMLNVYCVIDVFTKYAWVKPLKNKKNKTVLNTFMEMNLIVNQVNNRLIKEKKITINLSKNGQTIMTLQCTPHIVKASQ